MKEERDKIRLILYRNTLTNAWLVNRLEDLRRVGQAKHRASVLINKPVCHLGSAGAAEVEKKKAAVTRAVIVMRLVAVDKQNLIRTGGVLGAPIAQMKVTVHNIEEKRGAAAFALDGIIAVTVEAPAAQHGEILAAHRVGRVKKADIGVAAQTLFVPDHGDPSSVKIVASTGENCKAKKAV